MFSFLEEILSITVSSLRPPNRQNKKRKQRRAVERFEGEVTSLVDEELQTKYLNNFPDPDSRKIYAEKLVKTKIIEKEVDIYKKNNGYPWNKFKVGEKHKLNIKSYLKEKITHDFY